MRKQDVASLAQQERVGSIDNIRRCQPIVNEASRFPNLFRKICSEGDDVVIRCPLDFVDASDGELRPRFNLFQGLARNSAHLSVYFADSDFHVQPFLELVFFRPDAPISGSV